VGENRWLHIENRALRARFRRPTPTRIGFNELRSTLDLVPSEEQLIVVHTECEMPVELWSELTINQPASYTLQQSDASILRP
jgi:hypothetical protein